MKRYITAIRKATEQEPMQLNDADTWSQYWDICTIVSLWH